MAQIDILPPLRQVIATHQLAARKSMGQNFLLDLNLTAKIARHVGKLDTCDVLEIGPGPGGLTRGLLAEGARRVVAIEKDQRCMLVLDEIAKVYPDRLCVINADALTFDPMMHLTPPIRIAANLPYNIGTELLIRWLTPMQWPPFWDSMTLMFQREVAERIVAQPNSKAYGRLAILTQWRADAKIVLDLPPQAFTPPPKVSSSVVHITKLDHPRFAADGPTLSKVTAAAFGQRRKMIRASLKSILPNTLKQLESIDLDPTARAETLSLKEFCAIANLIKPTSMASG